MCAGLCFNGHRFVERACELCLTIFLIMHWVPDKPSFLSVCQVTWQGVHRLHQIEQHHLTQLWAIPRYIAAEPAAWGVVGEPHLMHGRVGCMAEWGAWLSRCLAEWQGMCILVSGSKPVANIASSSCDNNPACHPPAVAQWKEDHSEEPHSHSFVFVSACDTALQCPSRPPLDSSIYRVARRSKSRGHAMRRCNTACLAVGVRLCVEVLEDALD